jgi:hypothetical protein
MVPSIVLNRAWTAILIPQIGEARHHLHETHNEFERRSMEVEFRRSQWHRVGDSLPRIHKSSIAFNQVPRSWKNHQAFLWPFNVIFRTGNHDQEEITSGASILHVVIPYLVDTRSAFCSSTTY